MIEFESECRVRRRHVISRHLHVPRIERIFWCSREMRRPRKCCCTIDGWKQHEVTPGITNRAATNSQAEFVAREPKPRVSHESGEELRATRRGGRALSSPF